jgi:secretion/DNA translocation related TadE-like protein
VTVVACALCALLLAAGAGATAVAEAVVVRDRAAVAADTAALAAAVAAVSGGADACAAAARVAVADGAAVSTCRVHGSVADVTARAAPPPWLGWAGAATLHARAGPADVTTDGTKSDEPAPVDVTS